MSNNNSKKLYKKSSSFLCPFCGNKAGNPETYYSHLTKIVITRFVGLINSSKDEDYLNGVLDCIYKVFGGGNLQVRETLKDAGYLEMYDLRVGVRSVGKNG
jgi:hypothetical protein